ncbi:alpha-L-fucosidase [Mariniblastus sp.]|nr:alpha-L-fucosidase [Mariniblastus sp.]
MTFSRREMIKFGAACALGATAGSTAGAATRIAQAGAPTSSNGLSKNEAQVPVHLKDHAELFEKDPLAASAKWFREAKYGLFVHYGIYSLMEAGEWVLYSKKVPLEEYNKLADRFTAEKFDVDQITDLALEGGMKYITFTSRHHDSYCMFDTKHSDFKSTNSPCKRDFIGEFADNCRQKGLAFFPYYSYGRDWRHPHAPFGNDLKKQRANGKMLPMPTDEPYDMKIYEQFVNDQLTELLTNYGDIAGIWFDAPPEISARLDVFTPQKTYDMIHKLQPHALISAKWGITDTEDFYAPEFHQYFGKRKKMGRDIPMEICDKLGSDWGWRSTYKTQGLGFLRNSLAHAAFWDANLLINTGPKPDGSLFAGDVKAIREMGQELKTKGYPNPKNFTGHMHQKQRDQLLNDYLEILSHGSEE